MQTTKVKNVGTRHGEWKNDMGFYKDELTVFKNRLLEVASKNTGKEIMQMVEHFQNQFLIQSGNIDKLLHDINQHLHLISSDVRQHAGQINNDKISDHFILLDRFERETVIFRELKVEFMQFLVKVM